MREFAELNVKESAALIVKEIVAEIAETIVPDKVGAVAEQIWYPFMHLELNNKVLLCVRGCYD